MANPNPAHKFQPGESGNPNGRPPLPEDIRQARKLNKIELERVLNEYIYLNASEIKARLQDTTTPALELMVGKIIAESIKKGDERRLSFLLDRLIGAVKTKVSVDGGEDGEPVGVRVHRDVIERIEQIEGAKDAVPAPQP